MAQPTQRPRASAICRLGQPLVLAGLLAAIAFGAQAASPAAGKAKFEDTCAACHSVKPGETGGMAPNLAGLSGHAAGTNDKGFDYTPALKRSKLVWSQASLDRFLTAPGKVVPGTAMTVAVPVKADRDDIVAYLLSLKPAAAKPAARRR
jgi:cytochrome c